MPTLTLAKMKKHLNIDADFHGDDEYITQLGEVAEKMVFSHIDDELTVGGGSVPAPLVHAMLLLVGTFYANRESVAFANATPLPHAYELIIGLYKNYNPQQS